MTSITTALQAISSTPPNTPQGWADNVDSTHPFYLDFELPSGIKPNIAKLSFKFRLYRTYNSYSASATGSDATGESGHSHSHAHSSSITFGATNQAYNITTDLNGNLGNQSGQSVTANGAIGIGTNAAGSSGHSHSHTHSISGSSTLGVTEGTSTTITAIAIDGADVTAALGGGPWGSDVNGLDITSLMPTGDGKWHTISLTPSGLGRIVAILRLG